MSRLSSDLPLLHFQAVIHDQNKLDLLTHRRLDTRYVRRGQRGRFVLTIRVRIGRTLSIAARAFMANAWRGGGKLPLLVGCGVACGEGRSRRGAMERFGLVAQGEGDERENNRL
jgi:hypothetical protein